MSKRLRLGFTLIEVMLAVAVFAIAGVALLGAAQNNFENLSRLEQKTVANWVASNQLTAASLDKTWPPKNNRKGQTEMAGSIWYWQQKVERTQDSSLRSITIEIRKNSDDEKALTELTTFVARPVK
ncbi:type II secretion system minor pseudopilin GspI [Thalassotalea sp. M1531]|uniref:Type II secretion system protein I n=1 Tax=Thalassotalea algicola TaxID=2716224 RepID=A0A7Y0L9U3_9GAMM|nr:type II secretion system minor pseudopilin GspI [Thalassotalea algicola]NMP30427.1 type II secretion system minor pseudopilin GspI [Thalassotalea algicola]